jgi:hypothetical protein
VKRDIERFHPSFGFEQRFNAVDVDPCGSLDGMPGEELPFSCTNTSPASRTVRRLMRRGHARGLLDMVVGIDEAVVEELMVDAGIEEIEGKSIIWSFCWVNESRQPAVSSQHRMEELPSSVGEFFGRRHNHSRPWPLKRGR